MKLIDFIKELEELRTEHGDDIQVRVWADHGQTSMAVCGAGAQVVEDATEYMGETIAKEDFEESPDDYPAAAKVIEISA